MDGTQITCTAAQLNGGFAGVETINVYNGTGGAFTVGMLLHVSGYDDTSGYIVVEKADCDDEKPAQLIAIDTTASTKTTTAVTYYEGAALNTATSTIGNPVYLSATAGEYTLSIPTGADDTIQIVGRVMTKAVSGTVLLDLRFGEQSKFGTDNYVDASVTAAKLATDVGTTLAGTAASTGLTVSSNVLTVNPSDNAVTVGTDYIHYQTAAGLPKKDLISDFTTAIAGTAANSGLISASGVLAVSVHDLTAETPASGDLMVFSDEGTAGDPNRSVTVDNFATFQAGTVGTTGISATAGVLSVNPTDNSIAVATDYFVGMTAAGAPTKDLVSDVATAMAGEGIAATTGVLSLDVHEVTAGTVDVANDLFVFDDATDNSTKREAIADLVTAVAAGTGVTSTSGVISVKGYGSVPVGTFRFGDLGDCDKVTVGAVDYVRDATPVATDGEWTEGISAAASATNLAAGINADTRNGGGKYYIAWVDSDGDTVFVAALTATTNAALSRTGGAQPTTTLGQAGGLAPATKRTQMVTHTVTADDVDTSATFQIPVPFVPTMFIIQVRDATGALKAISDLVTITASPNRILITSNGATHCAATDIVTLWISE